MYPEILENHLKKEYLHDNFFDNANEFTYVYSYYHTKKLGFPIGMHAHSFYEINIIIEGNGRHYIEKQSFDTQIGSVYVIPPNIRHGYYCEDNSLKIFHILISCAFIERYKQELHNLPGYTTLFEIEPYIRTESQKQLFLTLNKNQLKNLQSQMEELISLEKIDYKGFNIFKIAKSIYLIGVFSQLIYNTHNDKHNLHKNTDSVAIIHTMEYMRNKFYEKIPIEKLAKIAKMSRATYLRQFKSICKCTPLQYLTDIRIAKAAELLQSDNKSVTEIAQDCGFFDCSHFTRLFTRSKGITPSAYKNQK